MEFDEVVRTRRSVRGFLNRPVPREILDEVFALAQRAPSNCNVQPWRVFVASGAMRDELSRRMIEATHAAFSSGGAGLPVMRFEGDYRRLQVECAQELYGAMGVARDDIKGRIDAVVRNYEFFDAPHVAFICMEQTFDIGVALDVGMYIQTLMLALWSRGIGSCAQAALASHHDITREMLEIPHTLRVLCGLSFGYEDESVPANRTRQARDATDRNVRFF
jgi:nitroreductase